MNGRSLVSADPWIGKRLSGFDFLCAVLSPSISEEARSLVAKIIASPSFAWMEFVDLATDQLVAPSVVARLDQLGLQRHLPDAVHRYFRAVHRLNGMRNAQIKLECITIAAALNEIGVTPVFFKGGGALLADLYDDPAGRIISDLDILVPATRSAECINRLQAWGYVAGSSPRHPEDHSSAVLFPNSGAAPIDLHRDVVAYPYRHLLPAADVLKHAIVLRREGAVFAVPSSTHQIIINVGHAQLHRNHGFIYGRLMLRSLIEISLMCRRWPDSIDWPEVENRFAGIGASTALNFHRIAAAEVFGRPVSPTFNAGWRARLAFQWAYFLTRNTGLLKISDPPLRVLMCLNRELSSAELRRRLCRNMADRRWWSRHLAVFWRGGTAAAKSES